MLVCCFNEFEGTLPEALQQYCTAVYIPLRIDIAKHTVAHRTSQLDCHDVVLRNVLRSNVKVFFTSKAQQRDATLVDDISSIFRAAKYTVEQPSVDRLICTASILKETNGNVYVNANSKSSTSLHSIATPSSLLRAVSPDITSYFASTCTSMVGLGFGDRIEAVCKEERESNRRDPDLQIQKAESGLYIGPYIGLCDVEELRAFRITHAINASGCTSVVAKRVGIKVLDIELRDRSTSNLLEHLPKCRAFIQEAIDSGGSILINCYAGISRSASILIDYWMQRDKLTFRQARDKLLIVRSCIKPNSGFRKQLEQQRFPNKITNKREEEEMREFEVAGAQDSAKSTNSSCSLDSMTSPLWLLYLCSGSEIED